MASLPRARLIAEIHMPGSHAAAASPGPTFRFYGWGDVGVVGSALYQDGIRAAHPQPGLSRAAADAILIPEPSNPHDQTAVRVDLVAPDGAAHKAGYLARADAKRYFKVLYPLAKDGHLGVARAKIWAGDDAGWRVYLSLGEPDELLPRVAPKPGGVVFLAEHDTAVVSTNDERAHLRKSLGRSTGPVTADFELLPCGWTTRPHPDGARIGVFLGSDQIGLLTERKSEEYGEPFAAALDQGWAVWARGWIAPAGPLPRARIDLPIRKYTKTIADYFYRDLNDVSPLLFPH